MAELVSLNVGLPREIETPHGVVTTAIFKSPTDRRLRAEPHNLEGDRQADPSAHGGPNKAVYGYPLEHYAPWSRELDRTDLTHGHFGENLTTRGLLENEVRIGDVYSIGSSLLQVTQPRSPCFKLGLRMGDPRFVRTFHRSGRTGFYFAIVQAGEIGAGDEITLVERGASGFTVRDIWELSHGERADIDALRRALQIPTLGTEWSNPMRAKLTG